MAVLSVWREADKYHLRHSHRRTLTSYDLGVIAHLWLCRLACAYLAPGLFFDQDQIMHDLFQFEDCHIDRKSMLSPLTRSVAGLLE